MTFPNVYNASGLMELIHEIGFLPLLDSGITGFSAEDIVDEDYRCERTPEESYERIFNHLKAVLPEATDRQILKLIG